jgi:hypothetical protein
VYVDVVVAGNEKDSDLFDCGLLLAWFSSLGSFFGCLLSLFVVRACVRAPIF